MEKVLIEVCLFVLSSHRFLSLQIGTLEQNSEVVQMLFVPLHTPVAHVLAELEVLLPLIPFAQLFLLSQLKQHLSPKRDSDRNSDFKVLHE
jgi:hypothetical protein